MEGPFRGALEMCDEGGGCQGDDWISWQYLGGHHYWKTTVHKILRAGYYWPSIFSDVCAFVKACDKCQRFQGKEQLKSLPLKPITAIGPFQQRGLDFIGEIHPSSSNQHKWILVATDYFTKWIEAIPTRNAIIRLLLTFCLAISFPGLAVPGSLLQTMLLHLMIIIWWIFVRKWISNWHTLHPTTRRAMV